MTERKGAAPRAAYGWILALASLAAAPLASADTVLLDASSYITGTQSAVYSLSVAGPGTVSITLADLNWPERLSSLSFALATTSGVIAQMSSEGTQQLALTSGGTYYALVAGTAQGMWNAGMWSLHMGFSQVAPVPLPAGVWLLLSGAAGLFVFRRGKETVTYAG